MQCLALLLGQYLCDLAVFVTSHRSEKCETHGLRFFGFDDEVAVLGVSVSEQVGYGILSDTDSLVIRQYHSFALIC